MKIFLPFTVKEIGGTTTFATKFKQGMELAGHSVSFEPISDYDVLFLIVQCPLKYLLDARRRGKKIIQRLDGTYYWSVSGWKFPLLNAKAAYIRHFFTDFTIYQSHYSQDCANRFLGKKRDDKYTIIYNGVDLKEFSPEGKGAIKRDNPQQNIFFTASAFRRKDQITPIIDALEFYRLKHNDNFKFYIAGTFSGKVKNYPSILKKIPYVALLGKVTNSDLPQYERSADVFLFTHLNPPCPNNIIESLACGLPIVGLKDGAMTEIVTSGKNGLLVPVDGTGFWKARAVDSHIFSDMIALVLSKQKSYSQESSQAAKTHFSLSDMIDQYQMVLKEHI